jgi:hypothetical protein
MTERYQVSFNIWPFILVWIVLWGTAAVVFESVNLMFVALIPVILMATFVSLVFIAFLLMGIGFVFVWLSGRPVKITRNGTTKTYQRGKK